jgi:hypothetical protein
MLNCAAMKTSLLPALAALLTLSHLVQAAPDVKQAQAEVARRYPEIAVKGSPMNLKYIEAVNKAAAEKDPVLLSADWPIQIAKRIAPAAPPAATPAPAANTPQGSEAFVKMTAAQFAANAAKLKGKVVEMTGIAGIEVKDLGEGLYELKIKAEDGTTMTSAKTLANFAKLAAKSPTLYVSLMMIDKNGIKIAIHGNALTDPAAGTPTPSWR